MYSYLNAPYWTEIIFWFPQEFSLLQLQLPSLIPCDSLHLMKTSNHMKSCRLLAMLGTASNIFEDFIESQRFLVFSMRMVSPAFSTNKRRTSFHSSRYWSQWITRTSLWGIDGLGLHLCLIQASDLHVFLMISDVPGKHHVPIMKFHEQVGWKQAVLLFWRFWSSKSHHKQPNQLAYACMYFEEMKMFRTSCRWFRTSWRPSRLKKTTQKVIDAIVLSPCRILCAETDLADPSTRWVDKKPYQNHL